MRVSLFAWQPAIVAPNAIVRLEHAVASYVRVAGVRAGAAGRAIVVEPVHLIPPGRGQLGMTDAAPANERELDGL